MACEYSDDWKCLLFGDSCEEKSPTPDVNDCQRVRGDIMLTEINGKFLED